MKELRDDISCVEADVADLQAEHKLFSERLTFCENNLINVTDICSEIRERDQRAKNVILHGFTEHGSSNDDLENVNLLLAEHVAKPQAKSVLRLGKIVNDKIHPLKLIFDSREVPMSLFKDSEFFSSRNLKVTNDSTARKRELLRNARKSLQERTDKGETNLTIKFIRGVPTVIKLNQKNV